MKLPRHGIRRPRIRRSARLTAWSEAVSVRVRGGAFELRRRLRPAARTVSSPLRWVAPRISRALFVALGLPAALIAAGLDLFLRLAGAVRLRVAPVFATISAVLSAAAEQVTPVRTVAAVTVVIAAALAASQFADYRGVEVGDPQYPADIARTAPPPLTDVKEAGSAHLYALVPAALLVVALTWLTARGRWQLGRAIALVGLAGIALAVLVDRPEGLDAGTAGVAYVGTDATLLDGFWAQIAACVGLVLCGPLLGRYVRLASSAPRPRRARRSTWRPRAERTRAGAPRTVESRA
jgi:hypothetical protein